MKLFLIPCLSVCLFLTGSSLRAAELQQIISEQFHAAAKKDSQKHLQDIMDRVLETNPQQIPKILNSQPPVLHDCIYYGFTPNILTLLFAGADPNLRKGSNGHTPLHAVVYAFEDPQTNDPINALLEASLIKIAMLLSFGANRTATIPFQARLATAANYAYYLSCTSKPRELTILGDFISTENVSDLTEIVHTGTVADEHPFKYGNVDVNAYRQCLKDHITPWLERINNSQQ